MGSIPLTDKERTSIQERLKESKKRSQALTNYIACMEKELQEGTAWCTTPEESAKMQKETEEIARKDKERSEHREIERYGRVLTHAERMGWTRTPDEIKHDCNNQP